MSEARLSNEALAQRLAELSPEKRRAFEKLLREQGIDAAALPIVPRRSGTAPLPLSFAQQRLWFLDRLEPGMPYNIPQAVHLRGRLNFPALEQSLNEIIKRHEIFRTTFAMAADEPVQVIAPELAVKLETADLSHLPENARQAEARRRAVQEMHRSFDLQKGPLLHATLLRLNDDEHVFLRTVHHLIFDGWSADVFVRELKALYEAFIAGQPSPLPPLSIQYADFALWQRQHLQGETLAAKLAFWKNQLAGAPPVLELPTDRPRPAKQTFRGVYQSFTLSRSLTKAVQALGQKEGATLFMILLAAFKILLHRYSAQDDIVVGTPVANRQRPEIENLIGFFINTLPLRTDLRGNPSFRKILSRVRQSALQSYDHQDLPFEKLVEELQPERDMSRTPLFQTLFVLQNTPRLSYELAGLTLTRLQVDYDTSWFDLSLYMWEEESGLVGSLEYSTDLFNADTMARLLGHYRTLLESIVADPAQRLSDLALLTVPERRQLLVEWNNTQKEYPREKCFHHLFEAQVERAPEAVAVVFENQQLTYRELNQRANQLAHHLSRHCGVGPEALVGICCERSLEMVVGLLGILKAGGAYVPLDPAFPADRLAYMLEDAQVPVLLTQKATIENFQLTIENLKPFCLDADWEAIARESFDNPPRRAEVENAAYVIYTSGSTGKPKGVVIPHRALVNFLISMQREPGMSEHDTLLAVTTLSFDIAGLELYLPLLAGGRVLLVSRDVAKDAGGLMKNLQDSGATIMQATPATWRLLLEAGWRGRASLKILIGGEAVQRDLAEKLQDQCAALWNMYGPTETTIWSTTGAIPAGCQTVAIGRPIANTQIYLLDNRQQPVPIGIPGNLCIGGDGVARGYLHRPELTAEKFVPDAVCNSPGRRMYHTGDLAKYQAGGDLDFIGRNDFQIKLRGFRIELGEIEAALAQNHAVKQNVVAMREDVPGDPRLVAYLVANGAPLPPAEELQNFLRRRLPDYMIPATFVALEALPLTPNGKVDRRALPVPNISGTGGAQNFAAPHSPVENEVAEIWSALLHLPQAGIHDDFFRLGGHSLMATRLVSRLRAHFGVEVPLQEFFRAPTIAHLAGQVEAALLLNSSEANIDAILDRLEDVDEAEAQSLLIS